MAKTFLSSTSEETVGRGGKKKFPAKVQGPGPPTYNLRRAEAREPFPGARRDRTPVVVQWMTDTEKAILLYSFEGDCHFWLPRWLWPPNAVVEMAGEAGPVNLPRYLVQQLGLC